MSIPMPGRTSSEELAQALDAATPSQRHRWLHGLDKRSLESLFRQAEGQVLQVEALHGAPGEIVIHQGVNSLPAFRAFQKRVSAWEGRVQGYNHQTWSRLTGPGHFLVVPSQAPPGEVLLDYTRPSTSTPPGFPRPRDNRRGLARLVFGDMVDILRRVSTHVTIGSAMRHGAATGDWFCLCRTDG